MHNEYNNHNEEVERTGIRIQKYLSDLGIASRRKSEQWIAAGLVSINGEIVTEPGRRFDPSVDKLTLDPSIMEKENYVYYLYHKPVGIITVNAQEGEQEIRDIIKLPEGVVPVGRLDKMTSGLIFLTNDGVAARRIMDPDFDHEKEYEVSFFSPITDEAAKKLEDGMYLRGEQTKPVKVSRLGQFKARLILKEGKNRQVRRLCEQNGYPVRKLKRVRVLNFLLGDLAPGKIKQLNREEIEKLFSAIGLDRKSMLEEIMK